MIVKVEKESDDGGSVYERGVLHPHGELTLDVDGVHGEHHADEELSLQETSRQNAEYWDEEGRLDLCLFILVVV